jgi:2-dehydro-3-deoxygalactonokinase
VTIIGVEWTSMHLAATLIGEGGDTLAEVKANTGAASLQPEQFPDAFHAAIPADWLAAAEAIYFTGMVTGRGGWVETGFVAAPALLSALVDAAKVHKVPDLPPLVFLPGLSLEAELPEVMRGEELKLYAAAPEGDALLALPGRHTKWAEVRNGRVMRFATYMGGETAALLKANSLVGRLIPPDSPVNPTGFRRGVETATKRNLPGGLLRRLFSARSLVLFDRLEREAISSYLDGLVIGAELVEVQGEWPLGELPIRVIGAGPAADSYREALALLGHPASVATPDIGPTFARIHAARTVVGA